MQRSLARRILRKIIFRPYRLWSKWHVSRFDRMARNLRSVQREALRHRVGRNRDSVFGKEHNFSSISGVEDFRSRIPITTYEYYEPYIRRLRTGQVDALFGPDQQLVMFALTSGTQTARKFIPITEEFVQAFRRGWLIWGVRACMDHAGMLHGSILQLASDWDEFRTEGGIPCGSVSGLIANLQGRIVRRLYSVPPEVGRIKDVLARHYTTLRLAVPRDVSYATTANPSTLVNLARLGDVEKETLLRDIADGTLSDKFEVPPPIREVLQPLITTPNPDRARQLEQIVRTTGSLLPKDYWPGLVLIGTWTGGAVSAYLRHFPALFGATPVRDVGLIASEGRMTIPFQSGHPVECSTQA